MFRSFAEWMKPASRSPGIVIELTEPFLVKKVSAQIFCRLSRALKKVFIVMRVIIAAKDVQDRASFVPEGYCACIHTLHRNSQLEFQFDPRTALRDSIAQYVRATFTDKDEVEQTMLVTGQFNQLLGFTGITEAMTVYQEYWIL